MPKEKVSICIPKVLLRKLIAHASREYPLECCGILAGKNNKILKVFPMKNTEKSPSSYFMDPAEQYQVFRQLEQENLELLAIYHSHPYSDAYPSPKDIDLSYYPDTFMVIISLRQLQNPAVAAFRIEEGRMEKIAIKIL